MALTLSSSGAGGVFTLRAGSFGGRFQASVTPPASATLLLDTYPGAAAAYSLRKLRTAYTGNCIQVRRNTDGVLLNIGFVNNILDTTTLQTFIGANTGVVSIWYDQSGNGNNAICVDPVSFNNAPIIIQSGVLVTDVGKVALQVDTLGMDISGITVNSSYAGFSVMSRTSPTGFLVSFCASTTVGPGISFAYNDGFLYNENSVNFIKYAFNLTGRFLFTTTNVSTVQTAYRNAALQATTPTALAGANVLSRILARVAFEGVAGKSQEHIFYNTNQASNRTAIESNINSYYSIYWQGTGTALLDLYPSAAAAYSLRNLSSTYTGPLIRVRRSSDNAEQDIYGTFAGVLDTTALTAFCGAGNGFVTTWYDQSGNAVNSIQTTSGNQPQIVTSGVVNLQGTKPTLSFNGTTQFLTRTDTGLPTGNATLITLTRTFANPSSYYVFLSYGASSSGVNVSLLYGPTSDSPSPSTLGLTNFGQSTGVGSRSPNIYNLQYILKNASTGDWYNYINNSISSILSAPATTTLSGTFNLGSGLGYYYNGNIPEVIIYPVLETSNRTAIESNINSYYSIY